MNLFQLRGVVRHIAEHPLSCYKFTVNHGFTGLIAYIKRLFHIRSKVSQKQCSSSETVVVATVWLPSNTDAETMRCMFVEYLRMWLNKSESRAGTLHFINPFFLKAEFLFIFLIE